MTNNSRKIQAIDKEIKRREHRLAITGIVLALIAFIMLCVNPYAVLLFLIVLSFFMSDMSMLTTLVLLRFKYTHNEEP